MRMITPQRIPEISELTGKAILDLSTIPGCQAETAPGVRCNAEPRYWVQDVGFLCERCFCRWARSQGWSPYQQEEFVLVLH